MRPKEVFPALPSRPPVHQAMKPEAYSFLRPFVCQRRLHLFGSLLSGGGGNARVCLAWLHTDYRPHRLTEDDQPLAPKTVRNVWTTLCSFFTWAGIEFGLPNPMKAVPAPRFERPPVEPFSKEDGKLC